MNCPKCNRIIPITKILQPTDDTVMCVICHNIISTESIVWADGNFHFIVLGDVTSKSCRLSPRILMKEQLGFPGCQYR